KALRLGVILRFGPTEVASSERADDGFAPALCIRSAERRRGPAHTETLIAVRLRNDVEVDVEHGLTRRTAIVLEHVVRPDAGRLLHGSAQLRQHLAQRGCGSLG